MGPINHVLDGVQILHWKGQFVQLIEKHCKSLLHTLHCYRLAGVILTLPLRKIRSPAMCPLVEIY